MKKYLIRLNRPVIVNDSYHGSPIKQTIYGFLGTYDEYDSAEDAYNKEIIESYVSYLAAMHQWSENDGKEFFVCNAEWVDQEGDAYPYEWREMICQRDRKTLGLDYTLSVIDLNDIGDAYLKCGMDGNLVLSPILMDKLLELAGGEDSDRSDKRNVILFNRPIWLPKHILWEGEDGFCHIYGLTTEQRIDSKKREECVLYLGYLAMIEDLTLNGITASGFTADIENDGDLWYDQGEAYSVYSSEVKAESHFCRKKHNLKLKGVIEGVPLNDLIDGVRNDFIISKALYEDLLDFC